MVTKAEALIEEAKPIFDSIGAKISHENRLRCMTDRLVRSDLFAPAETDRMRRIQAAYDLAHEIDDAVAWSRDND